MDAELRNLLISRIAVLLQGCQHVAVGAASPIPAAGALLAQHLEPALQVSLLGSESDTVFTDGGRELFDCAAQGRIDAFFFSGVQIDGDANINLVGVGDYPQLQRRFSGSFGSAYLYHLIPRIILFCWSHRTSTLVKKVDFISAAGPRDDGIYRSGQPRVLLTDRCEFKWQRDQSHFELSSLHPGQSLQDIEQNTAMDFVVNSQLDIANSGDAGIDSRKDRATLSETDHGRQYSDVIEQIILPKLASSYPQFVLQFD